MPGDLRDDPVPPSTLLRSARRLDWRFLLPDMRLGRVAYVGRPDAALYGALERVAARVEAFDGSHLLSDQAQYDLVVCRRPTEDELDAAVASVAVSGATLYAEIERTLAERLGHWRNPAHVELDRVRPRLSAESFWHWPDFANCEEIAPLADTGAIRLMLARRAAYGSRAKASVAAALAALELFGPIAACVSIVATSGEGAEARA